MRRIKITNRLQLAAYVMFGFLLGLTAATQHFAHAANYHWALGAPIFFHVYYPWLILIWALKWHAVYMQNLIFSGSIGTVLTALWFVLLFKKLAIKYDR